MLRNEASVGDGISFDKLRMTGVEQKRLKQKAGLTEIVGLGLRF